MEQEMTGSDGESVDEELEAMLYSQVHYDQGDQEGTEAEAVGGTLTSYYQQTDDDAVGSHSAAEMNGDKSEAETETTRLFRSPETVYFHNSETALVKTHNEVKFDLDGELGINRVKGKNVTKTKKRKTVDIPASEDVTSISRVGSRVQTAGNIVVPEASSKVKENKSVSISKLKTKEENAPTPKASVSVKGTEKLPPTDFIKLDTFNSLQESDYRKTLSRLLTSQTSCNTVKDIVTVGSNSSCSSSSSSSRSSSSSTTSNKSDNEVLDESDSESSTSDSPSDSDMQVLGDTLLDRAAGSNSTKQSLDLNWNVNSADRETIERIENTFAKEENSNLWMIKDADLRSKPVQASRYYSKNTIRCYNCDKQGHSSKICPEPKKKPNCGLCGERGHTMHKCWNRLCFNCNLPGHIGAKCPAPRRDLFRECVRCQIKGHSEEQCPDLWRQYHSTVTTAEDLVPKRKHVNSLVYCCNCAKRGHFAFECWRERMDKYSYPSYPFVVRYEVGRSAKHKRKGKSQGSDHSRKEVPDGETVSTPPPKRFKRSHHSNSSQNQSNTKLYPRGSQDTSHNRATKSQERYFNSPRLSKKTHQCHESSRSPKGQRQWQGGKGSSSRTQGAAGPRQLSEFAHNFVNSSVFPGPSGASQKGDSGRKRSQARDDSHFDWDGGDCFPAKSNKKKRKRLHAEERATSFSKGNRKGHGERDSSQNRDQQVCLNAAPDKNYSEEKLKHKRCKRGGKKRAAHSEPRNCDKMRDTLVITTAAGFRTVAKTMKISRGYHNT